MTFLSQTGALQPTQVTSAFIYMWMVRNMDNIIISSFFSKPAVAENIYDVPSVLLRRIPDYSLGRLRHCHVASFSGLSLLRFFFFCTSEALSSEEQRNEEAYWRIWGLEVPDANLHPWATEWIRVWHWEAWQTQQSSSAVVFFFYLQRYRHLEALHKKCLHHTEVSPGSAGITAAELPGRRLLPGLLWWSLQDNLRVQLLRHLLRAILF